jgi:hypothetical protein
MNGFRWLRSLLLIALLAISAMAGTPHAENGLSVPPAGATELSSIDETASQLVKLLLAGDFGQAAGQLQAIRGDFRQLHRQLEKEAYNERKQRELAVMHMWLREMEVAIHNHSAIGGAIAANQLTAALIRYRNLPDKMQTASQWLAYLAREIELLNMEDPKDNAGLLELRRNDAGATWQKLRAHLLKDLRNKTLVMNVDGTISRLNNNDGGGSAQIEDARRLQAQVKQIQAHLQ